MEIELQDNNIYNDENNINNDDIYKHSKLSNNPNEYHEDIKPDSAYEDGGIIEKKKYKNKNNWDISTNTEKDNNYIDNNNINNENNIKENNKNDNLNDNKNIENENKNEVNNNNLNSDINKEESEIKTTTPIVKLPKRHHKKKDKKKSSKKLASDDLDYEPVFK